MKKKFNCECGFSTDNIFELGEHHSEDDMEIMWMARLSERYSFNLFPFFSEVYKCIDNGNYEKAKMFLQATGMAFLAAMNGDLEELVDEAIIQEEVSEIDESLKKILMENNEGK